VQGDVVEHLDRRPATQHGGHESRRHAVGMDRTIPEWREASNARTESLQGTPLLTGTQQERRPRHNGTLPPQRLDGALELGFLPEIDRPGIGRGTDRGDKGVPRRTGRVGPSATSRGIPTSTRRYAAGSGVWRAVVPSAEITASTSKASATVSSWSKSTTR